MIERTVERVLGTIVLQRGAEDHHHFGNPSCPRNLREAGGCAVIFKRPWTELAVPLTARQSESDSDVPRVSERDDSPRSKIDAVARQPLPKWRSAWSVSAGDGAAIATVIAIPGGNKQ